MREITESPSQEVIQRAFELIREPNVVDVCLGVNLGKFTRLIWITDIEAVTKEVNYLRGTGGIVSGILVVEPFKVRALCLPNIPSRVAKNYFKTLCGQSRGTLMRLRLRCCTDGDVRE